VITNTHQKVLQNLRIPLKLDMNKCREILALHILMNFHTPRIKFGNLIPTPTPIPVPNEILSFGSRPPPPPPLADCVVSVAAMLRVEYIPAPDYAFDDSPRGLLGFDRNLNYPFAGREDSNSSSTTRSNFLEIPSIGLISTTRK
jgi:hypothetical protein